MKSLLASNQCYLNDSISDDLDHLVSRVKSIDLRNIKRRVIEYNPSWNSETIDFAEDGYRNFLLLCSLYPFFSLSPNEYVDEFWHHHILDTRKYEADCITIFGKFLHHTPSYESGSMENKELVAAQTKEILDKHNELSSCLASAEQKCVRCYH